MDVVDRPVLQLPPVPLPPSGSDPQPSSSFAQRALLSIALLVGVLVLGIGILVALVALNVYLAIGPGKVFGLLLVATFVVAVGLVRGLVAAVKRPPDPEDELEIAEQDEPELYAMVRAMAAEVGTAPPDRIVLVPEVNAYVSEFGPFMGLVRGRRTLAIGAPLLDTLDVSQLRAVLAHELGHFAGGDTRLGPIAYRTEMSLANIVASLGDHVTVLPFVFYLGFQRKVSAGARRDQELVADHAAVRIAGRQAAADALRAIEVAAHAEAVLQQAYLVPLLQAGARPADLASGFRALLTDPVRLAELTEASDDVVDDDPWASHPATPVRIARVAAVPEVASVPRDRRAARVLLRRPDHLIAAVNDRWLDRVTTGAGPMERVSWDAWCERVMAPLYSDQAADVEAVLGTLGLPSGVAGVHQAITGGRERELAAGLVGRGWRSGASDERTALVRAALSSVAATTALGAGDATWAMRWSGTAALRRSTGATIELRDMTERAVAGDWSAVHALLGNPTAEHDTSFAAPGTSTVATSAVAAPAFTAAATGNAPIAASGTTTGAPGQSPAAPPASPFAAGLADAPELGSRSPIDALPDPPAPFVPGSGPWRYAATLPNGVTRSKPQLLVGDEALTLDGRFMAYAEIAHASVQVRNDGIRSFKVTITLVPTYGSRVQVVLTPGDDAGKREAAIAAQYVWMLLQAAVAPRRSDEVVARIEAGERVEVAGLVLSARGVSVDKITVPWSDVGDPEPVPVGLRLPTLKSAPLLVKDGAMDEFLLEGLIPRLRVRFG